MKKINWGNCDSDQRCFKSFYIFNTLSIKRCCREWPCVLRQRPQCPSPVCKLPYFRLERTEGLTHFLTNSWLMIPNNYARMFRISFRIVFLTDIIFIQMCVWVFGLCQSYLPEMRINDLRIPSYLSLATKETEAFQAVARLTLYWEMRDIIGY